MSSQHLSSNATLTAVDSSTPGAAESNNVTSVVDQEGAEKFLTKDRKTAIEEMRKAIARQREILASMEVALAVLEAAGET
ncbi:hypothetical protein GYMLUDRAFT_41736 [Collybiopsis luxurians FD-317 M1]|uniref:Uncharacterized protein n=1 Tax=Collybiopsis luxurians FD-317 M1 TaxID=944289 RepID=A0A0D0C3X5_9AGAR|nr:hypothetical protein GYMLUDRAFT_41736 [Collybiopsis luxurians FD-317 M1]